MAWDAGKEVPEEVLAFAANHGAQLVQAGLAPALLRTFLDAQADRLHLGAKLIEAEGPADLRSSGQPIGDPRLEALRPQTKGLAAADYYEQLLKHAAPEDVSILKHPADQRKLERFFDQLPPNSHVIDVGSGGGDVAELVYARGHSALGIDPSATMVAHFNEKAPKGSEARVGFADDLAKSGVQTNSADAALLSFALIHMDRIQGAAALKELARAVRPGGSVFVATNVKTDGRDEWLEHTHNVEDAQESVPPTLFYFWEEKALLEAFRALGFEDIEVQREHHYDRKGMDQLYVTAKVQ